MALPIAVPIALMGAKMLAARMQQKEARDEAHSQLPAQILARSAAKWGAPMEEYNTQQQLRSIDKQTEFDPLDYGPEAAMLAANIASADDPTGPEKDMLEDARRQKLTGFSQGYNPFKRHGF